MSVPASPGPGRPVLIGHRGSPSESPENTMVSFRRSLDEGAEMLELDVRLSRDGVPVVIHDEQLERVTGRPGTVGRRTLKHIRSLDAGHWFDAAFAGERVPTLEEALEELTARVPINVEIKFRRGDFRPLAGAVAQVIRRVGAVRKVLVSSFRHEALPLLEEELPGLLTAPLFSLETGPPGLEDLDLVVRRPLRRDRPAPGELPWRGRILCLHYSFVNRELAEWVRRHQGGLVAWTVDHPADMMRLADLGVAGIITNRPALLRKIMDSLWAPKEGPGVSPGGS